MKKRLFIIVSTTILIACSNTEKHKKSHLLKIEDNTVQSTGSIYIQKYNDESLMDSLKARVDKGDKKAFNDLQDIYFLTGKKQEFLYYALFMAENYNYKEANYAIYFILKNENNDNLQAIGNYYLIKSYESGMKSSKNQIIERLGKNIPSEDFLKESVSKE